MESPRLLVSLGAGDGVLCALALGRPPVGSADGTAPGGTEGNWITPPPVIKTLREP